jgi:hypothetical protein
MTWPGRGSDPALPLTLPCVVLCPPVGPGPSPGWFAECREAVLAQGLGCVWPSSEPDSGPEGPASPATSRARWVAHLSAAIRAGYATTSLVVVAEGASAQALPALALAQRAARHSIVGYVLADTDVAKLGASCGEWPAAPVTYVRTPGAAELGWRAAQLHGWRCVHGDPVTEVIASAAHASGGLA